MTLTGKKVLLTYGPTWVAIDDVRVISNISTGELGKRLALVLAAAGAKVTALEGPVPDPLPAKAVRKLTFRFYEELAALLQRELKKNYDIVIHAAAVSDYRPAVVRRTKISSHKRQLRLCLVPTAKLIDRIKTLAPRCFLVGFKLESASSDRALRQKAEGLLRESGCDLVVANSLNGSYTASIIDKKMNILGRAKSRAELANKLIKVIRGLS